MIYGTLTNEQSYLFSSIDMYCVLHFVTLVSIVMAALHEKNVSLILGPSRLAGLSCYLLSLTGWAWFQILSWYICPVVYLPSSEKQNKLNSQTWCRKEGPWFPVSRIAKLRGHYGWFFGEMMLIWEEKKLGLERYTHKPVQLVRWWDQRHLVVVVDYLIIFYKLFTSYFNF